MPHDLRLMIPQHKIRSLRCKVLVGSTENGFAIRKHLRDHWQEWLLPVFQKGLDAVANGGRVLHIPKITLRIKVRSEKDLAERLPDLVSQQLTEQLQALMANQPMSHGETISWHRETVSWNERTEPQHRFDVLVHYLKTGSIRWEAVDAASSKIVSDLKETCREQCAQILEVFLNTRKTEAFTFRLFQLILNSKELASLVETLSEQIPASYQAAIVEILISLLSDSQTCFSRQTCLKLAMAILHESVWQKENQKENNAVPDLFSVVKRELTYAEIQTLSLFIASLSPSSAMLFQKRQSPFPKRSGSLSSDDDTSSCPLRQEETDFPFAILDKDIGAFSHRVPQKWRSALEEIFALLLSDSQTCFSRQTGLKLATAIVHESVWQKENQKENNAVPDLFSVAKKKLTSAEIQTLSLFIDSLSPSASLLFRQREGGLLSEDRSDDRVDDDFRLMVNDAGLILLHAFFPRFFENTGIEKAGQSKLSSDAMAHAASLLHYLATGREEIYEFELGFIKVLLGVDSIFPLLVCEGLLTVGDKEEAEVLLQSVIGYWTVLKNTSVAGLRSSFLMRHALLREEEDSFKLNVERKPFDLLLNQLPWGIQVVQLPWMKKPIYTEW